MQENKKILDLAIRAGEILLHNGAEIFRVQETMIRIADAYGANRFNVYVISNGIFASVDNQKGEVYCTDIRHVPLAPVHLGRVAAVNQLSRDIVEGKYAIEEAAEALERIAQIPYTKGIYQILWAGIGSGCFCYIFGGNVYDSIASFVLGAVLYTFLLGAGRHKLSKMMLNILGSGLVTLCGLIFFAVGIGEHMDKMIIGSIIPLVPGVPLTNAIRDFFNGDYLSGMIRLIDALLIAFCIAVGVGTALTIWNYIGIGGGL
ncbi:MAG: threonine/serine ThrE exporter family protein [Cellulosilyticaceae bacterium]